MAARIVCGEKKHPGGKLVRICLRIAGGMVRGVLLSGDFFADPEDEAEKLIERLAVLETSPDKVAEKVLEELDRAQARIYGIDKSDVEEALKRALASLQPRAGDKASS